MAQGTLKQIALKETALLFGLLFLGFVIMPIAIYWIGPLLGGIAAALLYKNFLEED